jgi:ABC-type xylose transport system permease subunit
MMQTVMSGTSPVGASPSTLSALRHSSTVRSALVLLLLWAGLALYPGTSAAFLRPGNLSNITAQVAEIVIISVGMTFVILTGGIDLSVGSGMALFGVVAATLVIDHHQSVAVAIGGALAVSVLIGLWHGFLVAYMKVPPFIATLSGYLSYRGIGLVLSDSRGMSPLGPDFAFLGGRIGAAPAAAVCSAGFVVGIALLVQRHRRRAAFGLPTDAPGTLAVQGVAITAVFLGALWAYRVSMPVPVLIAGIAVALGAVLLTSSRLGRYAYAIGGNPEAARLSGIPVMKVRIAVYVLISVLTAVAALVAASRSNGVTPGNMGDKRELHVITAVVIGGTSLSGGRATMLGTLLGALIFGTLSNGMNLLTISSNWQLILTGMILLGASMLDSWSRRSEIP